MGLTLIAILTAALLLPGIIAARTFYLAGQTPEIEVPVPALSTPSGITLVGIFSIAVHCLYIAALALAMTRTSSLAALPPADPYRLLGSTTGVPAMSLAWSFLSGLLLLSVLAALVGFLAGRIIIVCGGQAFIHGPLAELIALGAGKHRYIAAFVVTKVSEGNRLIGYQGTVSSLIRDADRFPTKVVLKDVTPFYLVLGTARMTRRDGEQIIDWLTLTSADWHNIAFRVFEVEDAD